jgi:hypothetical protein
MRWVLVLGALVLAMIGSSGPPRAEDARPVPKVYPDDSGLVPIPAEHEMVQRRYERLMRQLEYEKLRKRPRGDFWPSDEIKRYFGRP